MEEALLHQAVAQSGQTERRGGIYLGLEHPGVGCEEKGEEGRERKRGRGSKTHQLNLRNLSPAK